MPFPCIILINRPSRVRTFGPTEKNANLAQLVRVGGGGAFSGQMPALAPI